MLKIIIYIGIGSIVLVGIAGLALWLFFDRSTGYIVQKSHIDFVTWSTRSGEEVLKLESVDLKSFEIIKDNYNNLYAKDASSVFYMGRIIVDANSATFKLMEPEHTTFLKVKHNGYMSDKRRVYSHGVALSSDKESFRYLGDNIGIDINHVYLGGEIIKDADAKSYEYLGHSYGRDSNKVFIGDIVLEGANPSTFRVKLNRTATDGTLNYDEYGNML